SDPLNQQLFQQSFYQATSSQRIIEGSVNGTFGIASTSVHYRRQEQIHSYDSSTVYGNTPRVAASLAPQMLFGVPLYASVNSEYAYVPNQRIFRGEVTDDRTLQKWDLAPTLRLPLSRLTYLSVNTSASYRSTYYSRSDDSTGRPLDAGLLRQYLSLGSQFIGPVLTKIWDTPNSRSTERMKHVIEPTFLVNYTTEFDNQANVPKLPDQTDFVVGGTTTLTYGLNNRFFYRGRATSESPGRALTREFVTIGLQQTYYSKPESSAYDGTYISRRANTDLSPIQLTARVAPTARLDANARLEYDVNGNGLTSLTVGSSVNGATTSANVSYSRSRYSSAAELNSLLYGSTSTRLMQGRVTGTYSFSWDLARSYVASQT
ncbi:MAG: hypothetical protein ACRD2A_22480, partial [Vicinamibacterales bacterium]